MRKRPTLLELHEHDMVRILIFLVLWWATGTGSVTKTLTTKTKHQIIHLVLQASLSHFNVLHKSKTTKCEMTSHGPSLATVHVVCGHLERA